MNNYDNVIGKNNTLDTTATSRCIIGSVYCVALLFTDIY